MGFGTVGLGFMGMSDSALGAPKRGDAGQASSVVETHRGKVRGMIEDGIKVFKGIPYATVAERFRPPQPAKPWTGVRDTLAYGPICPQLENERASYSASWMHQKDMAEDCLSLNIWTPGLRDGGKRPVMVWLHGGGFYSGSGSQTVYDGTRLSRRGDVVVVTLNHRLSVFGFLYLAHLGGAAFAESGNAGMLDLVAALRWVQENSAAFGGDPGNVTIFGQSGGGAKVSVLMGMPSAQGLFHKAIVQSGSHLECLTPEEATRFATAYLAALGLPPNDPDRLMTMPAGALLKGLEKAGQAPGQKPNFSPVVDGVVLPRDPWLVDAPALSANVPLLVGSTRTETTALIGGGNPGDFALDEAGLIRRLAGWVPAADVPEVVAGFRRLMPDATPSELFFAITTDRRVRQQAWTQAERKAAQDGAPVFLYELDWTTPVEGGKWGSPHSLDLPFVFDNVARSASMVGTGPEPQALAEQISSAWVAFARTGRPEAKGLPAWPAFTQANRATMVFDAAPKMVPDWRGDERTLLAPLPLYRVFR